MKTVCDDLTFSGIFNVISISPDEKMTKKLDF